MTLCRGSVKPQQRGMGVRAQPLASVQIDLTKLELTSRIARARLSDKRKNASARHLALLLPVVRYESMHGLGEERQMKRASSP